MLRTVQIPGKDPTSYSNWKIPKNYGINNAFRPYSSTFTKGQCVVPLVRQKWINVHTSSPEMFHHLRSYPYSVSIRYNKISWLDGQNCRHLVSWFFWCVLSWNFLGLFWGISFRICEILIVFEFCFLIHVFTQYGKL